ncbi:disease resistance protein [Arabidopsis thaliana]|uniref:Probable disease resistance RPP8-like protein 4 n=2 Tax=Arabidopsis thaliana TaxID=3702 RepID=RP8L4_ARATH|nr:Disease resistance protein (CC-NBS-LRR class) family [Arabidopsis thaliana]NP_001331069.1 Disease resistance protein (CC-NBS-LRR class) family [Arabidopsis thaliana]NP_001331070.1 Disease resistance protein (CC-NBS-LRR class) family [Arabidopsis thaliana]NP_001331071.1 Disease resistance protein (CC-NBS-LRR class) family [Arabidopsis thaliana]NP_001331072.1 Disease resistance protein (CC-NBS-LRR class) family [Arabidopsis thaliana]NP_199673.1 Disease resistance protein (CC-NBS-LRR class) fa|eukprot:NP_001331068.1 Disease resistance protein (CC-NBS-LRR class) family [Arabidopsis thaliana]
MAEGFVSFGLEKLWDLLSRESERLQGIDEQLDGLKRQLRSLQSLLKDADAKKHGSDRVRNFLEDVKDLVFDAEDIIESYVLNKLRGEGKGVKKHVRRLARFLTDRHKVASDIEGITKRISDVIGEMQSFGIQQIIDGVRSLSLQERQRVQREIRQTYPDSSESDLVGVEQSVEELVGHLVENDIYQVVSIAGMGGIGKTTLARQVFHHDLVRRHFDGFAWVCVSQQFTLKHVWQRILQELQPHDGNILQMDESALQPKLFQLLETGRYLLVLDDVWKKEDWDRIKAVFPRKRGWKMLLTSRNEGVGIHADPTCLTFRASILNPEESWKLCERIVFPRRDETEVRLDEEMEAMGKEMVTHCGGLPLAVKALGGLLANKHTVPEWKRVSDNIGSQIVGGSCLDDNSLNSVNRILSLSYEDLPTHLKHRFLYLAHFPEDSKIYTQDLFNYWAAEGIYDGSTIQDSGEYYLEELVRRNLVIADNRYLSLEFNFCQMHDMMREVCLSKAKEENFLQIIKDPTSTSTINAQSPSRSRRFSIHSGKAFHILGHRNNPKVRSLIVSRFEEDFWIRSASVFHNLTLLRVLDLSRVKFEGGKLPSSIGGLIHLRYLSLYGAVVSHLPSTMRNLKLLLFLNLRVDNKEPIHVPNVLKEMLELRYLSLPQEMDDKTKLELGDLVNLEYLWYFSTQHSSVTDLLRMTKLRNLGVSLSERCNFETLSSSLRELRNLEMLNVLFSPEIVMVDHMGEFVLDHFIHLKQLGLAVRMSKIPDQHQFPPHLAHIHLVHCVMKEDPMPILEKLLHLKSVALSYGAFIGRRVVCSKGGFPQLCALGISGESELEEWIVEEGSMPCLRTLTIHDCEKLKELPDGLKYITSLKELKIREMKREWKEKLVPGGEDYYKVQHIPDVQFINCDL